MSKIIRIQEWNITKKPGLVRASKRKGGSVRLRSYQKVI